MAQLDAAQQPTQARTDAQFLIDKTNHGANPDCVFSTWDHNRQMQAWKELKNIPDANGQPYSDDFRLSFTDSGTHLSKKGTAQDTQGCTAGDVSGYPLPNLEIRGANRSTHQNDAQKNNDRAKRTFAPELAAIQQERLNHPEVPAEKIEALANKALMDGPDSERAKLDLRQAMINLMNEPNADFRNKVLNKLVDDGSYMTMHPLNGRPHVEITKDGDGKPTSLTFSHNLGLDKQEIPLNKTIEQQVEEAQQNYVHGLQMITGGLGKFDPDGTMKAYDILNGAEPGKLRWFMLYRKDQGKPAVDLEKVQGNS